MQNSSYFNQDLAWRVFLTFCLMTIFMNSADMAVAAGTEDVIGDTLCRLIENLTGGIAKSVATAAIFAVGIGLFMGKLNWGTAFATAAGVGIIFGAGKIMRWIGGGYIAGGDCDSATS